MMRIVDHQQLLRTFGAIIQQRELHWLGEDLHTDAVIDYPQSGERFRGLENIRGQFENYPEMDPETSQSEVEEVIGGTTYVLTPSYTVVGVDGSGDHGVAIIRIRYPDASIWYAIILYELRDGRVARSRAYFAPVFDPPDWRAPFREPIDG